MTGRSIILASWISVGAFAVPAGLETVGIDVFHGVTVAVCLAEFLISLPVWAYAFGLGVVRSGRGDNVTIGGLFFLTGTAPREVRRHLLGAVAASIVIALGLMFVDPYVVLVPMLPMGLVGVWGARHGSFGPRPRPTRTPARGERR